MKANGHPTNQQRSPLLEMLEREAWRSFEIPREEMGGVEDYIEVFRWISRSKKLSPKIPAPRIRSLRRDAEVLAGGCLLFRLPAPESTPKPASQPGSEMSECPF